MMGNTFGIKVDDGSDILSDYGSEQTLKIANLYEWQHRALKFFEKHPWAIYQVSTGAGKTYLGIEIIKHIWKTDNPNMRCLIVVPKNVILERGWYKELHDAGIPLYDIGIYYGPIKEYSKITITNMQNINRIPFEIFDIIIYDEVHNYGTKRLLEYVEKKVKYKIGLTATIERMDESHYDLIKFFNYNVFKYSAEEALNDHVLNRFNFYNIGIHMDSISYNDYEDITQQINTILKAGGGYNKIMKSTEPLKFTMLTKINQRKALVNNYSVKFEVAKQICKKHMNDKVIVFNQFNEQTNKLYWYLLDIGANARVFHSGIDSDKRNAILSDFKNDKFNILLTTKVLDEGYNLPKIDTAIIMAGDSTPKQTIQRMGRVLRKKDKNSTLYQIYCVDTIEQDQGDKRAKMFKELSSDFKELFFSSGDELVI